jgi:hypothetical protein
VSYILRSVEEDGLCASNFTTVVPDVSYFPKSTQGMLVDLFVLNPVRVLLFSFYCPKQLLDDLLDDSFTIKAAILRNGGDYVAAVGSVWHYSTLHQHQLVVK